MLVEMTLQQLQSHLVVMMCEVPHIVCVCIYRLTCTHAGPTECQDGVTNNCTDICTRDIETMSHSCSCREGYIEDNGFCYGILLTDTFLLLWYELYHRMHACTFDADIDECADTTTHNCSDADNVFCSNTMGSFTCLCRSGYSKVGNGGTCVGKC